MKRYTKIEDNLIKELDNYKVRNHRKTACFIKCQRCKEEGFKQRYYQTSNLLYLCENCYKELKEKERSESKLK